MNTLYAIILIAGFCCLACAVCQSAKDIFDGRFSGDVEQA